MGCKTGLLVATVCGLGMGKAYAEVDTVSDDTEYVYTDANAPHQTHVGEKPTKFYVGLVGGIERMTGRRTEGLREPAGLTIYQSNKRMLENKATISAVGGFLWKLPPPPSLDGS